MSDHGTSVLELSDKGNCQTMTLKSTSVLQSNGDSLHVKDLPQNVLSNGHLTVKEDHVVEKQAVLLDSINSGDEDNVVVKDTLMEKQDALLDSINSGGEGISVGKKCVTPLAVNGLSKHLLSQAPDAKDAQNDNDILNSIDTEKSKCDDHLPSSSPTASSPVSVLSKLPESSSHSDITSEKSCKPPQSNKQGAVSDCNIPKSPTSPSLWEANDKDTSSKPSEQRSVDEVSSSCLGNSGDCQSQHLPDTSAHPSPKHQKSITEKDAESQSPEDSLSKDTFLKDDLVTVPDENAVTTDAMGTGVIEDAQDVTCEDLSEASNKNKDGSRISVLDFDPGTALSGIAKTSTLNTPMSSSVSNNIGSNISGDVTELMEVEGLLSEDVQKSSEGVDLYSSDSHMEEELKDGASEDAIDDMELQDDELLGAPENVDKGKDNPDHDGNLQSQGPSMASFDGAKSVDSPEMNECVVQDEIKLVSVCSVVDSEKAVNEGDADVVNANTNDECDVNENDGKVNTDNKSVEKTDDGDVNKVDDSVGKTDDVALANTNTDDGCVVTANDGEDIPDNGCVVIGGDDIANPDGKYVLNANDGEGNTDSRCDEITDDGIANTDDRHILSKDHGNLKKDDGVLATGDGCVLSKQDKGVVGTGAGNDVDTDSSIVVNAADENVNADDESDLNASNGNAQKASDGSEGFDPVVTVDGDGDLASLVESMDVVPLDVDTKSDKAILQSESKVSPVEIESSSCDVVGKSKAVANECLFEELEGECDKDTSEDKDDVIKMDTDDDDVLISGEEKVGKGNMNAPDSTAKKSQKDGVELRPDKNEVKECSLADNVKMTENQTKDTKSDDSNLKDTNDALIEIKDDVKYCKTVENERTLTLKGDEEKMSFKNILKSQKNTIEKKEATSDLNIGDDDVIILDENDDDLDSANNVSTGKEGNQNNNAFRSIVATSNSAQLSKQVEDTARKRSFSGNDNTNPQSSKRSRLDSEAVETRASTDAKASTGGVAEEPPLKEDTKMTMTSKMLRNFIMGSLKAAIWSHKLEKTVELEERMSKMEAASSLWKESGKHLEKSVEELTKFSKEIEKRKAQSQKLKYLFNRSVGVQVTPINPDNRSPHQTTRPMTIAQQQGRQMNQPGSIVTRQSPITSTAAPTNTQQQHRLPPSVLLNHGGGGQKPMAVSPSSTATHTANNKGRQPARQPQQQQQQINRPPDSYTIQYKTTGSDQRRIVNTQNTQQNPPSPYNNGYSNIRPRPPGVNQSPNSMSKPGQPRQILPAVNSGVIDLTDEDDMAKKPLPSSNKTFNGNNSLSGNNTNRSNGVYRGGNNGPSPQQHIRPQQQSGVVNNRAALQRQVSNQMIPPASSQVSSSRSGFNNAPSGGVTGLTGVRLQQGHRQTSNVASDGSRVTSSGIPILPPNPSLHNKHPAAFPMEINSVVIPSNAKLKPPKPSLKITTVPKGIVLSWNMPSLNNVETIASYQLYAYQESSGIPTSTAWKKVGDVKALPLPMACTLTQFQEGNKYHFAVRAVDRFGRWGDYSDPANIHLHPDSTTNTGSRES